MQSRCGTSDRPTDRANSGIRFEEDALRLPFAAQLLRPDEIQADTPKDADSFLVSRRSHCGLTRWQKAKTVAFIESNLHRQIKLYELAAECRLSVSHFGRGFKESFATSPSRFILKKRMERARRMLVDDLQPLSQIALECGMFDQSHLTRAFRSVFGSTPGSFRRSDAPLSDTHVPAHFRHPNVALAFV